jgi:hypothetical protein
MPAHLPPPDGPLFLPPEPTGDLRGMLRRRIVATALAQFEASSAGREKLADAAAWRRYSRKLQQRFADSLASTGFRPQRGPVRVRPVSQRNHGAFSIENVLFQSLPGCWVNATVWKPDPRRWAPPWRAVVTPVGHNGKYNPSEQFPPQVFAANGFLAVSFDPPGFGEKREGNDHFVDGVRCYLGDHNPLGFFLADACRVIDYVSGRPDVDVRGGVAMTGVSGGGMTSICCAIVDDRVSVIGPSCFGLPDAEHPVRNGYAGCPEMLWLGRFAQGLGLEELLIAARFVPMLLMAGRHDSVITAPIMRGLARVAMAGYREAGHRDRVGLLIDDCGHEYTVAQAAAFVRWVRRWWKMSPRERVCRPRGGPRLLKPQELECQPPPGLTMASFAAKGARQRQPLRDAAEGRGKLRRLAGLNRPTARRPLRSVRGVTANLWTHSLTEISLRDGADWELPATWVRRLNTKAPESVLVYFDARGRWSALHQWGWLDRAVEFFAPGKTNLSVLSVDLPGWGDTAPRPSPFDVVGWGGVDRWIGYISAATGDSAMAMRLREACRVLRFVRGGRGVPNRRIFLGGHGLGANIAAFAAWLEGPVAGLVLAEPLVAFAQLATAPKVAWPHDAYFPGILKIADFAEALRAARTPAIVVGPRDATQGIASTALRRPLAAVPRCTVLPAALNAESEAQVIRWLHARMASRRRNHG